MVNQPRTPSKNILQILKIDKEIPKKRDLKSLKCWGAPPLSNQEYSIFRLEDPFSFMFPGKPGGKKPNSHVWKEFPPPFQIKLHF